MNETVLWDRSFGVKRKLGDTRQLSKGFCRFDWPDYPLIIPPKAVINGGGHPSDGRDGDHTHGDNHNCTGNNHAHEGTHFHNIHNHYSTLHILAGSRPQGVELQAAQIFYSFDHSLSLSFNILDAFFRSFIQDRFSFYLN